MAACVVVYCNFADCRLPNTKCLYVFRVSAALLSVFCVCGGKLARLVHMLCAGCIFMTTDHVPFLHTHRVCLSVCLHSEFHLFYVSAPVLVIVSVWSSLSCSLSRQ